MTSSGVVSGNRGTVPLRFQERRKAGVFEAILCALPRTCARAAIRISTKCVIAQAVADCAGLPLAICTDSASPHEVTLAYKMLEALFVDQLPTRMIGDKYDSDPLDQQLAEQGIDMTASQRRKLRRYRRRWKVERLCAWLKNYQRLAVRYDQHAEDYLAVVQLGIIILLRHCF